LRRRVARLPQLSDQVQSRRPGAQGLRLPGQAGARQHSLRRRRAFHAGILEVADVFGVNVVAHLLALVADNIHSEDVARFMLEFWKSPRVAQVYNLGGGPANSCSILEAFAMAEAVSGRAMRWQYVDQNRIGDHICYYSDLRKMKSHFPGWRIEKSLTTIFNEIAQAWTRRI